ncbi:type I-F CRISPR-associated helicase Cas3f [Pseudomonas sp. 5P_5.1_Bac1]|uniref:type I-F CRISPR-associated helicase Cas3f n=1 Tax=Pseudomonas sp. 5P_5.1_Bac1 TaxID=2971616 RepID=UPI0021CA89EB|nr:type I-F CRISPR-associated helicase Cas3f [Pseudomonas sp. 5P_5.1_Bac1]MCU1721579.1 type I-F CRISPR-associated helicase Cas3f [Pseudomonas sp. 5P_5.1_Bac1]
MNILLICQCDKRALVETRRILDQFAERRGERTWQTPITQAGLDTLRRLLKKTARRNTAVACHWIRGLDHSELLWIVGDASRFNQQGAVPTNSSRRDVLRKNDENDWHTAEDIRLLTQMAALLHDLGKASVAFQARLKPGPVERNLYRHEWVSLRLFLAFVGQDDDAGWLHRLAAASAQHDALWLAAERFKRDGLDSDVPPPFKQLPPLAAAIAWLVVSHHRLPTLPAEDGGRSGGKLRFGQRSKTFNPGMLVNILEGITHQWNELDNTATSAEITPYWQFDQPLPVILPKWRTQAAKIAERLLELQRKPGKGEWLANPYVMHLSRLSLMLADHHYSSLGPGDGRRIKGDLGYSVFANTHSDGALKQPLDEHLLGVARMSASIVHGLPGFERHLPRLVGHRGLRKRSEDTRFRWQDKAADAAASLRGNSAEQGTFIINMASTGCGKTLANARIMNALAEPELGLRCTFALGLRTLTRQTGESYRKDLHLNEDDLALQVGGSASQELFNFYQAQAEATGSASTQALLEEDGHVLYEGNTSQHGLLGKAMDNPEIRRLLSAPLLVCTLDHLMPATEAQRAGRQIAPMLRLMSSDLVLDELDDFDLPDLPALTRLVHWSGLLGTRVLISSATLPPALVDGMFQAYRAGRQHYRRNRGKPFGTDAVVDPIPCLWLDEFGTHQVDCADATDLIEQHNRFVDKRVTALKATPPRRRGEILPLNLSSKRKDQLPGEFAAQVREAMQRAHARHASRCPYSGKRVSFGLVRMANIEPLFDVALALFQLGAAENQRIHLCVYHSRFPQLLRSAIEARLDRTLNRRRENAIFAQPEVRDALAAHPEQDHLFVVLGSPVTEVGRDHDYDWAVVEPSSMRSLIQLAGRVRRHRDEPCETPNVLVFDTNLRHFSNRLENGRQGNPAFIKPGFEHPSSDKGHPFRLTTHFLNKLLEDDDIDVISARARIQAPSRTEWKPKERLADLEHARLADLMLPKDRVPCAPLSRRSPLRLDLDAACAWQFPQAALTWALPQQQPFRESGAPEEDLLFLPDEYQDRLVLHRIHEPNRHHRDKAYLACPEKLDEVDLERNLGPRIAPWGKQQNMMGLLEELADELELPLDTCAERFTSVRVYENALGWRYHPVLGFAKKGNTA